MSYRNDDQVITRSGAHQVADIDQGLRAYMISVYNYMAGALAVTGLVAYFTSTSPVLLQAIFGSPLQWVVLLAPLAVVLFFSFRINSMSLPTTQGVFWLYAGLMGLSMASIFIKYTDESIARTFFVTAGTFGAMSLYGYTTRRDLTAMGSFLMMGLIGLIIASLVNIFMASSALQFAISLLGIVIFIGLTAYDTQRIKEVYFEGDGHEVAGKKAVMGALTLYLDFINLFIMLLRFMGDRR